MSTTEQPGPRFVDPASGRPYTVDQQGHSVWLDQPPQQPGPQPRKSHTGRNVLLAVVGGLVVIGAVGAAIGGPGSNTTVSSTTSSTISSTEPVAAAQTEAAVAPAETTTAVEQGTTSQENALRSAQSYIDMQGFSRRGLIKQLSSSYGDAYSVADATWAVDHLTVNWNRQAVRAGKSYLDMQGMSRAELIRQLSSNYGDQFTKAQATYAASWHGLSSFTCPPS
jgi:hypothetical protein